MAILVLVEIFVSAELRRFYDTSSFADMLGGVAMLASDANSALRPKPSGWSIAIPTSQSQLAI